jgi:hypothetical protein
MPTSQHSRAALSRHYDAVGFVNAALRDARQ